MGKQSHRVRASPPTEMKTTWSFYYWDEAYVNKDSETLKTCMERYGVGGWYSIPKDMVTALVFLSAEKTASSSWLLGVKHLNNEQAAATMYEQGARTSHLSLETPLGAQITDLLALATFVKA